MLNRIYSVILALFFTVGTLVAQQEINQVYSKYGIGEIAPVGTVRNMSMGGTGLASPSMYSINEANSALLIYNSAVSFEINLHNEFRKSKSYPSK